jgi:hypothetical protein
LQIDRNRPQSLRFQGRTGRRHPRPGVPWLWLSRPPSAVSGLSSSRRPSQPLQGSCKLLQADATTIATARHSRRQDAHHTGRQAWYSDESPWAADRHHGAFSSHEPAVETREQAGYGVMTETRAHPYCVVRTGPWFDRQRIAQATLLLPDGQPSCPKAEYIHKGKFAKVGETWHLSTRL